MEKGYHHPEVGYWQTMSQPDVATLQSFPAGTVEVPLKPGANYEWTGAEWQAVEPPPGPVPQVVSRFQARAALHLAGLLPQVEAVVAAADPLVRIAWADAQEFRRDSPTIAALASAVNLDDEGIDDLFRQAAQIAA